MLKVVMVNAKAKPAGCGDGGAVVMSVAISSGPEKKYWVRRRILCLIGATIVQFLRRFSVVPEGIPTDLAVGRQSKVPRLGAKVAIRRNLSDGSTLASDLPTIVLPILPFRPAVLFLIETGLTRFDGLGEVGKREQKFPSLQTSVILPSLVSGWTRLGTLIA